MGLYMQFLQTEEPKHAKDWALALTGGWNAKRVSQKNQGFFSSKNGANFGQIPT